MSKQKVNFDDYTKEYNNLLRESTSFFSQSEEYFARYKIEILRRKVPGKVKRILEYGCGIGRNIPFLCSAFPDSKIEGSDISLASLEIAREQNPGINFFNESSDSSGIEPYEIIFVAGVLHHIPKLQRASVIDTLYDRLAPGGTIIIFEHNPFNPLTRKIVNNCPYDHDAVLLRPSEVKSLLANAGLTVCQSAYCLFVPPSIPALLPLERKLGWLPLGGQYWVKASRSS